MDERKKSNFFQDCCFNEPLKKKKISILPLKSVQSSMKGWNFKENCKNLQSLHCSPFECKSKGMIEGKVGFCGIEKRDTPEGFCRKNVKLPSLKPQLHFKGFSVRSSAALKVMNRKLFVTEEKKGMDVTFSNDIHTPAPLFGDYDFLGGKRYLE
jgi:hypothetical protein